jgi:hypothetical protein
MVEAISSNMYLSVEAPDAAFDDARMMNWFGSDGASTPKQWLVLQGRRKWGWEKRMWESERRSVRGKFVEDQGGFGGRRRLVEDREWDRSTYGLPITTVFLK